MQVKPRFSGIILASQSPARAELLQRLNLPFSQLPAHIDETPRSGETPRELALRLAKEKAEALGRTHPDALVIGSDQVPVFEGRPFGKPGTKERAYRQLERFSGQEVEFLTAVTVLGNSEGYRESFIDTTTVRFRVLSGEEIRRYVDADDALECAGSFKVESLGPSLFDWVRSEDPTGLPGLPLIQLSRLLRKAGWPVP